MEFDKPGKEHLSSDVYDRLKKRALDRSEDAMSRLKAAKLISMADGDEAFRDQIIAEVVASLEISKLISKAHKVLDSREDRGEETE